MAIGKAFAACSYTITRNMNTILSPHRRYNPLMDEWVLVSPQRTQRPWQGQVEKTNPHPRPTYDANCYLCPGNLRAGNERNPAYTSTFAFTNDFAALLPASSPVTEDENELFRFRSVAGTCRVLCFSPRHDLTLAEMSLNEIGAVIELWVEQYAELVEQYAWVQIFENKGAVMGCSNPHPHGQIWASQVLPQIPHKEQTQQKLYFHEKKSNLLQDYLALELAKQERIVVENEDWVVIVPYWAVWPFETILLPRAPISRLTELHKEQHITLAKILKRLLTRYDNLFKTSFPYSMGWHGAPIQDNQNFTEFNEAKKSWQLHAHFYPPLLRSAAVKKFMVGYEMLAEAQRDLTPEQAAEHLRSLSEDHYAARIPHRSF